MTLGDPKPPARVEAALAQYPQNVRARLIELRSLILETARETAGVGPILETLKWGEPAYLTQVSGSGSTLRLGWSKARPDKAALYFNCKTSLVASFRGAFPDALAFEGDRAILLDAGQLLPRDVLKLCIAMALTYHRRARSR